MSEVILGLDTFGDLTVDRDGHPVHPAQVLRNVVEEAALADRLGTNLTTLDLDCDHMIEQARPQETAALVRKLL